MTMLKEFYAEDVDLEEVDRWAKDYYEVIKPFLEKAQDNIKADPDYKLKLKSMLEKCASTILEELNSSKHNSMDFMFLSKLRETIDLLLRDAVENFRRHYVDNQDQE